MKKMIIFGGIGLVVLLLLGGGGFFLMKSMGAKKAAEAAAKAEVKEGGDAKEGNQAKGAAAKDDDDEEEAPAKGGEGEGASGPPVMTFKQIVNLDGRKNAFLKAEIHILFRNHELGKLAASEKPTPENSTIRAIVLEAISGKTVEAATDLETRESLRQEIKDKLNEKFANKHSEEELKKAKKSGKPVKPPIKDVLIVDWAIQQ